MTLSSVTLRLIVLTIVGLSLPGCVGQVAHAVFAPALTSLSESSQTRESLGITTSPWRGKSCKDLEFSYAYMEEQQRNKTASGDAQMVKITGWQMEAIQEVRNEQGCLSGGLTAATSPGKVAAYGYCIASNDAHVYVTSAFGYADYFTDFGATETASFNSMLMSSYAFSGTPGSCLMEDSPEKAQAAIEQFAGSTNMQLNRETVRLTWIPAASLTTPRPPAVAHATAPTPLPPLARITPNSDTTTFCHAYLANKGQKGGAHSSLIKVSGPKTASSMLSAMVSFSAKAKASQPGKWGTFDVIESNCSVASGLCIKDNPSTAQVLGQFCFVTEAEAEAQIKQFKELDPGITQIE